MPAPEIHYIRERTDAIMSFRAYDRTGTAYNLSTVSASSPVLKCRKTPGGSVLFSATSNGASAALVRCNAAGKRESGFFHVSLLPAVLSGKTPGRYPCDLFFSTGTAINETHVGWIRLQKTLR